MKWKVVATSGLLALVSRTSAQVASVCAPSDSNVCFKLNIPANTASSGNGDIFFQLSAPTSYEWVGLGQGSGMTNANIFVVYVSSSGTNVTLSPRLGRGHSMPNFNGDAQVTLLEGSGVFDGKMVANVRCSNCNSWSGGSASFSGSQGNWIYGFRPSGGPKRSDSQSASIQQHSEAYAFTWEYANAKGGDSVNPLINSAPLGTASGTATNPATRTTNCIPRPTTGTFASTGTTAGTGATGTAATSDGPDPSKTGGGYYGPHFKSSGWWGSHYPRPTGQYGNEKRQDVNYCDPDSEGNTITPIGSSSSSRENKMLVAHGALAAVAFVVLFPAGSIAIRLASFPGIVWFHAAWQIFSYLVFVAAFGLGIWLANDKNMLKKYHPIIGIVVFVLLFFQPIFGQLHHMGFRRFGGRTFWSYIHLWLGRSMITLGIINGGLGFLLAGHDGSRSAMIAYSVIAGIAWLAMVAASIVGERRRKRMPSDQPPKYEESPPNHSPIQRPREPMPAQDNGYYAPSK